MDSRTGKKIKIIENINLPQISNKTHPNNKFSRCFNPSIFYYNSQIYYVYRIHIGGDIYYFNRILSEFSNKYPSQNVIYNSVSGNYTVIDTSSYNLKIIKGFEDPRVIIHNNKLHIFLNELDEVTKKSVMYILIIDPTKLENSAVIPDNILLLDYKKFKNKHQKNWMPFVYKSQLYIIYSLSPYIILQCNTKNGKCIEVLNKIYSTPNDLRGSSNIIKFSTLTYGKVFLGISHSRYKHVYTHRFFIFKYSKSFDLLAMSDEFIIQNTELLFIDESTIKSFKITGHIQRGIQFVAGLLQIGSTLYITYGEDDYHAKQFKIDSTIVESLLSKI